MFALYMLACCSHSYAVVSRQERGSVIATSEGKESKHNYTNGVVGTIYVVLPQQSKAAVTI